MKWRNDSSARILLFILKNSENFKMITTRIIFSTFIVLRSFYLSDYSFNNINFKCI